jgi:hypothetical protein
VDYVIAAAACVWMVPFLVLERRHTGRTGYLWRLVGSAPFVILAILALTDRFDSGALAIAVLFVVAVSVVGLALDERTKRRTRTGSDT